ncbi:hypothetical protein J0H58_05640 [bacterium]|mgnify:CR=1 FL=1|nr:hypothetical protein [bacterium]
MLTRLADALADADFPNYRLEKEREALALREAVAAANPDSPLAQRGVVTSKRRVAEALTARRDFKDAAKHYADAEAILGRFPGSTVLAAEAKAVAEGVEVLAGVRAAAANRESVKSLPPPVRARVAAQLADDFTRQDYSVEATWAATILAETARGPDDLYRAAVVFARAASPKGAPAAYSDRAVELLARAVGRGFNNPDLLRARWWDAVRMREAFKAVEARLSAGK